MNKDMEKKHKVTTRLYVEQFDNGWSIREENEDGDLCRAEVVEGKDEAMERRLGKLILADLKNILNIALVNVADITYTVTATEVVK